MGFPSRNVKHETLPVSITVDEALALPLRIRKGKLFRALTEIYQDPARTTEFFRYLKTVEKNTKALDGQIKDPRVLTDSIAAQLTEYLDPAPYKIKIAGDSELKREDGSYDMVAIKGDEIVLSEGIFTSSSRENQKALCEVLVALVLAKDTLLNPDENDKLKFAHQKFKNQLVRIFSHRLFKKQFHTVIKERPEGRAPLSPDSRASVLMYLCSARNLKRAGKALLELAEIPTFEHMLRGSGVINPDAFAVAEKPSARDTSYKLKLKDAYDLVIKPELLKGNSSLTEAEVAHRIELAVRASTYTFSFRRLQNPWQVAEAALWSEHEDLPEKVTPRAKALLSALKVIEKQDFESKPELIPTEANHDNELQMARLMQSAEAAAKKSATLGSEGKFTTADLLALYFSRHTARVAFSEALEDQQEAPRLRLLTKRTILPLLNRLSSPLKDELGYVSLYTEDKPKVTYLKKTMSQWCGDLTRGGRQKILRSILDLGSAAQTNTRFLSREKEYFSVWQKEEQVKLEIFEVFKAYNLPKERAAVTINELIKAREKFVSKPSDAVEGFVIDCLHEKLGIPRSDLTKPYTRDIIRIIKPFAAMVRNTDSLGTRIISPTPEGSLNRFAERLQKHAGSRSAKITLDSVEYILSACVQLNFPEGRRNPTDGWVIDRYQLELITKDNQTKFIEFEVHAMTDQVYKNEKNGLGPVPRSEPWWLMKLRRFEYSTFGIQDFFFSPYAGILPYAKEPKMGPDFSKNVKEMLGHFSSQGQTVGLERADGSIKTIFVEHGSTVQDVLLTKAAKKILAESPSSTQAEIQKPLNQVLEGGMKLTNSEIHLYGKLLSATNARVRSESMLYRTSEYVNELFQGTSEAERDEWVQTGFEEFCFDKIAREWSKDAQAKASDLSPEFRTWFTNYYYPTSNFDRLHLMVAIDRGILPVEDILKSAERFFVISRVDLVEEEGRLQVQVKASSGPKGYNLSLYEKRFEICQSLLQRRKIISDPVMDRSKNIKPFGHVMEFALKNQNIWIDYADDASLRADVMTATRALQKSICLNPVPLVADNTIESKSTITLGLYAPNNNDTILEILRVAVACNISLEEHTSFAPDASREETNAPALVNMSVKALLPEIFESAIDREETYAKVLLFKKKLQEKAQELGWDECEMTIKNVE